MKKNIIIVISGILLLIMLSLFYTYAINVSMEQVDGNADLTYNINLSNPTSTIITVEPGETKYFDIVVTNTNDGAINYGLVYNQVEINTVTVAQTDVSKYKAIDSIEKDETRRISLVIKNEKTSNITYSILPVTGYEQGGDLVVPSNHTLIDDVYSYKSGTITGSVHDYVPGSGSGGSTGGDNPGGDDSSSSDTSGANSPDLVQGLVPIAYDGSKWIKVNSSNSDGSWYSYDDKKWANAALVTSTYRNSDGTDKFSVGDEVPESAVLAYYVWIPRYKYKVFNINKVVGTDSYNARTNGIDVVFESGTNITGTVTCNPYNYTILEGNGLSETCSGSNGDYYTHPGFWWDKDGDETRDSGEELRGIWAGKFEVSAPSNSTCYSSSSLANCDVSNLNIRMKPNVPSWRYNSLSNFYYVISKMNASGNEYGLSSDSDGHVIKNSEWGAIVGLTHSKYGRCSNGSCQNVDINSSSNYITGCGPQSAGSTTTGTTCNAYNAVVTSSSSGKTITPTVSQSSWGGSNWTGSGGNWSVNIEEGILDESIITFTFTLSSSGTVSFNYSTTMTRSDNLQISLDNTSIANATSSTNKSISKDVAAGSHTLTITFSSGGNNDCSATIADLVISENGSSGAESLGALASTTGNVFGIYDMSGGAYDYVFAATSSEEGMYEYFGMNAGSNYTYSAATAKYINGYAYGKTVGAQAGYNRTRLGDFTGENTINEVDSSLGINKGWFDDYAIVPFNTNYWYTRGASGADAAYAGIFATGSNTGGGSVMSTRAMLIAP